MGGDLVINNWKCHITPNAKYLYVRSRCTQFMLVLEVKHQTVSTCLQFSWSFCHSFSLGCNHSCLKCVDLMKNYDVVQMLETYIEWFKEKC